MTGTANVLSAAVLARGRTIIRNAAREPEIVALGQMLGAMGARINGLGTSILEIGGVERLGGCRWQLIPDRMEAATFLLAAAITGGEVTAAGVVPEHLAAVLTALEATGAGIEVHGDRITASRCGAGAAGERRGRALSWAADRPASPLDRLYGHRGGTKPRRGPRLSHALGPRR